MDWRYGGTFNEAIIESISTLIHQKAEGNMLYASLVFDQIQRSKGSTAEAAVTAFPRGLRKLYEHKLTIIENKSGEEDEITKHWDCCKDVLVLTSYACRPISTAEVALLMPWSHNTNLDEVIEDCSAFLTESNGFIKLNHKSAGDYLNVVRSSRLQGGNIQGNEDIGMLCLKCCC